MAEFVALLAPVNALAEASPGFVWRLESGVSFEDDPRIIVNMSVWESLDALRNYVYKSAHLGAFKRRTEWFEPLGMPHGCMWWVAEGHRPTVAEARERLDLFRNSGPTSDAFWFTKVFGPPATSVASANGEC